MAKKDIKFSSEQEEIIKKFIAGDILEVTPEILQADEKKKDENPVNSPKPQKTQTAVEDEVETKNAHGGEAKKEMAQRATPRKSRNEQEFAKLFLVKRINSEKRQIYISKKIYNRIHRYFPHLTNEIRLSNYIDNILLKHIEDYKDIITDLFEKSIKKPI